MEENNSSQKNKAGIALGLTIISFIISLSYLLFDFIFLLLFILLFDFFNLNSSIAFIVWFLIPLLGLLLVIVGVVLAHIARKEDKKSGILAILIMGYISFIFALIVINFHIKFFF